MQRPDCRGQCVHGQGSDSDDPVVARRVGKPGGQTVYLSNLNWTSMVNGWGPAERDCSNGESAAGDGRSLTLRGAVSAKGLGMPAPANVRYTLPSGCSQFQAQVGVDDETGVNGSVGFEVWANGSKLYSSAEMFGGGATAQVNLTLTGQTDLRLVVGGGTNGINFDHADWAMARVTCP
jgi:alpha-galactosidase